MLRRKCDQIEIQTLLGAETGSLILARHFQDIFITEITTVAITEATAGIASTTEIEEEDPDRPSEETEDLG